MKAWKVLACTAAFAAVFSMAAFAEEDEMPQNKLSYESFNEDLYDGIWNNIDDVFEICEPSDWVELDTTDEENEHGIFYKSGPEDASASLSIYYLDADTTEAQYFLNDTVAYEMMAKQNGLTISGVTFNDEIYGYVYLSSDNETCYVALPQEDGSCYMMIMTPVLDDMTSYFNNISYSISLPETEDVMETETE